MIDVTQWCGKKDVKRSYNKWNGERMELLQLLWCWLHQTESDQLDTSPASTINYQRNARRSSYVLK